MLIVATLAVLWLSATTVPVSAGMWLLLPNVGMVMTLAARGRSSVWPVSIAFLFGLLQDVVHSTPLGIQALLLVTLGVMHAPIAERVGRGFFPQWALAAVLVLSGHVFVWGVVSAISGLQPSLVTLLKTSVATVIWYPFAYTLIRRFSINPLI